MKKVKHYGGKNLKRLLAKADVDPKILPTIQTDLVYKQISKRQVGSKILIVSKSFNNFTLTISDVCFKSSMRLLLHHIFYGDYIKNMNWFERLKWKIKKK